MSEASNQAERDQRQPVRIPLTGSTFKVLATACVLLCLLLSSRDAIAQSSVPAAPSIDAVVEGNQSLIVSWSAPASTGGSEITAYDLRRIETSATDKSDDNWTVEEDAWSSGTLEYTVSGLDNGTEYDVQVRAVNANGDGPWSTTATGSPDDHGDTRETATTLQVGTDVEGAIDTGDDEDYFKFELTQASNVIIQGYSKGLLGGLLYDSAGVLVDRGSHIALPHGRESFLILERLDPGEYYVSTAIERERIACIVVVIEFGAGADNDNDACVRRHIGPYTLSVATVPEPGSTLATASPLTLGEMAGGTIDPENDTDFFSITLSETTHVIVWAANESSERIKLGGTLLDSSGNPVTANLREKGLQPLQMGFYLRDTLAAGTHYLKVVGNPRPNDVRTGPYVIWAEEDTTYGGFLDDCDAITSSYSDPLFGCQWHLDNTGQGQGTSGEDINVTPVWADGNMGEGIVVAVLDDGVDPDHEDLAENVDKDKSHDYQGEDKLVRPHETHGTQVAGIIAARDNSLGMRGVAPRATVYSYNILAEQYTLENAVDALTRNMDTVAVSNNSWTSAQTWRYQRLSGFYDLALDAGVTRGYGGKGIFYVFAAGNEATAWDGYSNHDEYVNYYAVTTVCAVNDQGIRSDYSERGSNLWVCSPSSDYKRQRVATTSSYSRYTGDFGGTSSSAPQVAGVAALLRKANSNLTWRDVKLILAASARKNDPTNDGWDDNPSSGWHDGALKYGSTTERYSYSHNYGFGVVDAEAAVDLAESWTNLPPMKTARGDSGQVNLAIPDTPTSGEPTSVDSTIAMDSYVEFVEFVEVKVDFTHAAYRDLEMELVSPSGAVSILAVPKNTYEFSFKWDGSFRFGSARHLGEAAAGTWTLRIKDWINGNAGTLKSWDIRIFGHGTLPGVPTVESVRSGGTTLTVSWAAPDDTGSSAITDYELRYIKTSAGHKADANWTVEDPWTSGDLEYTLSGLESGVSYDIQMRAINSGGNGRWSDTVQASGAETPSAPVIGTLAADGHRALRVTWSAPVYQGASEITAYDVRYIASSLSDRPHLGYVIDNAWTTGSLEYRVSGIGDLREQDVQVRAVNASGDGEWSESRNSVPLRIGPSAPRIASGSPSGGDRTITINWSQPVHSGASSVIAYDIRYIRADGDTTNESSWTLVDNAWTSGTLTHTITGLENWVLYLIEVRAVNSNSDGDWTPTRRATPQGSDPPPAGDPVVTIAADSASVSESQKMTFTLHRSGAPVGRLRVGVGVTETGRILSSYHTSWTFESGSNNVSLFVTLRNDTVDEDDSVVTVQVQSGSGYTVGSQGSAQTTATDDDHVPVELAWSSNTVTAWEGDEAVTLLAVATTTKDKMPESDSSFEVVATSYDGTASQPDDYGQLSARATFNRADFTRVTVGSQQRYQAVKQFPVTIVNDNVDEANETFTATLVYADSSPSHLTGGNSTATVTITDDEHGPVTIAWQQSALTVNEGSGSAVLGAVATTTDDRRPDEGFSFGVSVSTSDGTATQPGDYADMSASATFARADFSRTTVDGQRRYQAVKQFTVNIERDTDDEPDETFTATLAYSNPGPTHLQGGPDTMTVTIADDDHPKVTITADADSAGEEDTMYFTLRREGLLDAPLSVNLRVTETGNMLASGRPTTAAFTGGDDTASLAVDLEDDNRDEDDSVVTVEVRSGSGYAIATPASAQATATDNDHVPVTLEWDRRSFTVAEDSGTVTLRARAVTTKDKRPEEGFTFAVGVSYTDGAATQPDDYSPGSTSATFDRDDFTRTTISGRARYQAEKDFAVSLFGDTVDEPDETFTAVLAYSDPARPDLQGGDAVATVTISDNDDPRVSVSADAVSVAEGTQSITFTLRRSGLLDARLRVNVRVTETGNMLTSSRPTSAMFEANSDTASLRVNLTDDAGDEEDSAVTAEVLDGTGYLPGSPTSAETSVTDDDHVTVTLDWEELNLNVAEDVGTAILAAVATTDGDKMPESGFSFEVQANTADGGAVQPDDYSALIGTATFTQGDFNRIAVGSQYRYQAVSRFHVPIVNDTEDEPDESFTATLTYADPGPPHLQGGNAGATVTIVDDDHVPVTLGWEQPELAVFEDAGRVALRAVAVTTADKIPESGFTFEVRVYTTDGSAMQPHDYIRLSDTDTVAWNEFSRTTVDGQRRYRAVKEYHVDIVNDTTTEPNEGFTANLAYSTPGQDNLLEGDLTVRVSIIEDVTSTVDLQLIGSASPGRISQGGSLTYQYTIRNEGPSLATGVSLVSNLDPSMSFISTDRPAECRHSGESAGGKITCRLTDLTSGQTLSISVMATANSVPDEGVVTRSRVSSSTTDRKPENNLHSVNTRPAGGGPPSSSPPPPPGPSLVPANAEPGSPAIGAVASGDRTLTVTWTAPGSDGGLAITAYDLRHIRTDAPDRSDANWTVEASVWAGSGSLEYTVTGLAPGTGYDVQARAFNSVGPGPWSPTVSGATEAAPPPADDCVTSLGALTAVATRTGNWTGNCDSANRSGSHARFYTFTLDADTAVTIDLTSAQDTYLFLLQGAGRDGAQVASNDDASDTVRDSQIIETLEAGTYTIEATTYSSGIAGNFTLTISGPTDSSTAPPGPTPGPGPTGPLRPQPTDDGCVETFETMAESAGAVGEWTGDCNSTNRSGRFARFYTFTLDEEAEVTVELTSEVDTYLFLLEGDDKTVEFRTENDDIESGNTNSRIVETLEAGTYTVEATTFNEGTTGAFTLAITLPVETTEPPAMSTDPCVTALATLTGMVNRNGTWSDDCDSTNRSGSYARFYTFTLTEETEVTIDLESTRDTYLFLLQGTGRDGAVEAQNDDIESGNTDSRIVETLAAGDYIIEATTYSPAATGDFTLTITGPGGGTPAATDGCVEDLGAPSSTVTRTGAWADGCESANREDRYARFYTYTLAREMEVTIELTSTEDPFLFLLQGAGRDGAQVTSNDDIEMGVDTNSRIVETLAAGTYTIEATTYDEEVTGEFTLSVVP